MGLIESSDNPASYDQRRSQALDELRKTHGWCCLFLEEDGDIIISFGAPPGVDEFLFLQAAIAALMITLDKAQREASE